MDAILTGVLAFLIRMVLAPLNGVLVAFAAAGELHNLTTTPWAQNLIAGAQALAAAVLAVRTAWEAFQLATLRTEGQPADAGSLLKRVALSAGAIAAGPWLCVQAMLAGNLLADAVAHAGLGSGLGGLVGRLLAMSNVLAASAVWMPLLLLAGSVIIVLCFLQAIVRTVEMTLAAIVSPLMAIGFLSGGGAADVWLREVIVLACSQAVQLLLLYLAAAVLVGPLPGGTGGTFLAPFLFVGTCWVAWRTPHILRQYAYHTGIGSAAGGGAAMAAGRLLTKLPF